MLASFRLAKLSKGPRTYAKLTAISPLLRLSLPSRTFVWNAGLLKSRLYSLLYARRKRIGALCKAGWRKGRIGAGRLLNCPPACCYSYPEQRQCRYDYFCPFCWVRHTVHNVYDRVVWGVYGNTELVGNVEPVRMVDLVLLRKRNYVRLVDFDQPDDIIRQIRNTARSICQGSLTAVSAGACSIATLEPTDDRSFIAINESVIALVIPGTDLADVCSTYGFEQTRVRSNQLDSISVAGLVGQACLYPTGLMTGDLNSTVDVLNLRARSRTGHRQPNLVEYWGLLRQFHIHNFDIRCANVHKEKYNETDTDTRKDSRRVTARPKLTGKNNKRTGNQRRHL